LRLQRSNMASLSHRLTHCGILLLCVCVCPGPGPAPSQQADAPPVPIWGPGSLVSRDGRVFLSGDSHEIVVFNPGAPGKPDEVIRVPLWNRLAPSVSERIDALSDGQLRYVFRVGNGKEAKDSIGAWTLLLPASDLVGQIVLSPSAPHRKWGGSAMVGGPPATVDQLALGVVEKGRYLQWFFSDVGGLIAPGESLDGFGVESPRLPGFTTAWFASGKLVEFDQSWPEEVFRQIEKLEDRKWREVYLAAIGPIFGAEEPREAISKNFMLGIRAWIRSGQLRSDSPFVAEAVDLLSKPPGDLRTRSLPRTGPERLLASAMNLSLHISSGPTHQ